MAFNSIEDEKGIALAYFWEKFCILIQILSKKSYTSFFLIKRLFLVTDYELQDYKGG